MQVKNRDHAVRERPHLNHLCQNGEDRLARPSIPRSKKPVDPAAFALIGAWIVARTSTTHF